MNKYLLRIQKKSEFLISIFLTVFLLSLCENISAANNIYDITNNYYPQQPMYSQQGYISQYNNLQFYIARYDRDAINYNNGAPMVTRMPIIGCNYPELADNANAIVPNAYKSIDAWIRKNVSFTKYQDFYLNYAKISGASPTTLILIVNCSLKRKGLLSEHMTFRINLELNHNWYEWERISDNEIRRVY